MSAVPFSNIPANLRVPLFFAEVNNSQANSGQQTQRALIIGQILASGQAAANVPIISQGVGDASVQGGAGSMLALMTQAYRAADNFGELWYLPVADAAGAVAAAGSVTFAGAPTANGSISLYIAGQLVSVPVAITDTPTTICTAAVAAINAATNLPVTVAVDGTTPAKCDVTAKNKGLGGNDIDLRINFRGPRRWRTIFLGIMPPNVAGHGRLARQCRRRTQRLGDQPFDFYRMPTTRVLSWTIKACSMRPRWSWSEVYGCVRAREAMLEP